MRRKLLERRIHLTLIISTMVLTVLRILLNEKGRATPDSVRFMRTSHVFPTIDNTTTPLGYPLGIKFFTLFGFDAFWASKVLGMAAYMFIIFFAAKKKFYVRETVLVCGLFSFISLFSATLSEAFMLPFVFVFLFVSRGIIIGEITGRKAVLLLSAMLILLFNVRYPAIFIMGGVFLFGVFNFKSKHYGKTFTFGSLFGMLFVLLYKLLFIDFFNEKYIDNALTVGRHSTAELLTEFFQGITTAFNPFIHIASPGSSILNVVIYGTGLLTVCVAAMLFFKNKLSESEKFFVWTGISGVVCSFFIQFVYVVDALDYRLLAPFTFPVWLVLFKKIFQIAGKYTYSITALSLATGLAFIVLSRANYLENRSAVSKFLVQENLEDVPLKFYINEDSNLAQTQIAELVSTVNPNVTFTQNAQDTLRRTTLTRAKVLRKIKIDTNRFQ